MRKTTAVMLASALAASAAIGASVAYAAAIGGAQAPYARAAALVKPDGTVVRSKGITGVRKTGTGHYCVAVDPAIDITKSTPVATLNTYSPGSWEARVFVNPEQPNGWCQAQEIFVYGNSSGAADIGFDLIVP
ncbi:hypothetical protein [Streptosporangium pseudovulgare]|uniref:SH3 domain-containing protein n=1 Tax=Streptosporangium pseudovulgare TaxID=35765 RepID=A0ABQ2RI45_9ACTN|nr:hypothetical protein [Streptosporangium pseudovulgare]GGQ32157.1 hypothetical protein GCM10010140_72820 [Streptosporangium pseudovulgare]